MRLMIVDDDIQIREGIRYGINWESIGISAVSDFPNGKKAWEAYDTFCPDIILADIRMPVMDGIGLLSKVREVDKSLRFVLLSAYSDFAYCKQAIALGANDYELKPVKAACLLRLIEKHVEELSKERNRDRSTMLAYQFGRLERFLTGEEEIADTSDIRELLEQHFHMLRVDCVLVALIMPYRIEGQVPGTDLRTMEAEQQTRPAKHQTQPVKDREDAYGRIKSALALELPDTGALHRLRDGQFLCLCKSNRSMFFAYEQKRKVKRALERTGELLRKEGVYLDCGISDSQPVDRLPAGYRQAAAALRLCFYEKPGSVVPYNDMAFKSGQGNPAAVIAAVSQAVKEGDPDLLFEPIRELERYIKEERLDESRIYVLFEKIFYEVSRDMGKPFSMTGLQEKCRTATHLSAFMKILKSELIAVIRHQKEEKETAGYSFAVSHAVSYVKAHFAEPISIEEVAQQVGKTPNYLSSIFKKEVGTPFSGYVQNVRMKHAKRLIVTTGLPVREIAKKAGYEDYIYFSKIFKKTFGLSASCLRGQKTN